ncbi:hypothetical protein OPT61_g7419 [Boeremia exigua]|uniref:Uncharacterized protein n=1 Tax=Boeremia exigua TaxID=749465 RepID=A0ACC2I3D9_9PLEO|nr:hypothetical protein OPT61_g7419 [Boeremia exigua]
MRCSFFYLAIFAQLALSQDYKDHRTTKDCVGWTSVDNATEETCEATLRRYNLEPVRFHNWNPSVGLDCKPWVEGRSYCVLTNATVWDSVNESTTTLTYGGGQTFELPLPAMTTDKDGWTIPVTRSDAPVRTTSTRAPIPSPATWKDMGCFVDTLVENWDIPIREWGWIMDFRFLPTVDNETLETCKQKCWEISYPVAGVKGGNECWCGDRNNGTLAEDQGACDMPCAGDQSVICGGRNWTSIWEAEGYVQSTAAATATEPSLRAGSTLSTGATATASSGANKAAVMPWKW